MKNIKKESNKAKNLTVNQKTSNKEKINKNNEVIRREKLIEAAKKDKKRIYPYIEHDTR